MGLEAEDDQDQVKMDLIPGPWHMTHWCLSVSYLLALCQRGRLWARLLRMQMQQ